MKTEPIRQASVQRHRRFSVPPFLSADAEEFWRRVLRILRRAGMMHDVDEFAVEVAARAYQDVLEASKVLHAEGYFDENGNSHPAVKIKAQGLSKVQQALSKLGMTPDGRVRLKGRSEASQLELFPNPFVMLANENNER